ncbi:uncharacterized protein C6orf136 homolog [Dicentrarchus labrax]|uniref:Si:ch211-215a10.4 n=1 Tax=Dicentrarchus labrax TaxID=13489 RepID=A0A8P4KRZ1_DICLA|nr:uncharacterized protein C6orf136 homolog [Dicentrarchus labrax]XP_051271333.1 uncharacterized protein C6orf136 homolog [Dicentrarchus labrax]XP_051271334.1 uncharacterized protein C6orf136 homolog [Dicentrarchus labrax]
MAVSRGGVAFWVGCVRSHGRRQPIKNQSWSLSQVVDWQWIRQTRPLSSASWALAPPNSLRYQNVKQPVLSHPFHHASQPHGGGYQEEDWEESLSVCVLVRQGESDGLHTLLEIPLSSHSKLGELLTLGPHKSSEFSFPLTTVDGSREDDISVDSCKKNTGDAGKREHGCFRSLFEAERCPAPFMYGSHFYCFHCPGTEPVPGSGLKSRQDIGLNSKPVELPLLHPISLCSYAKRAGGGHNEGEEKVAMMYERLRIELPNFFMKSHDYSMYSHDMEFINGLINTKTRGRVLYQLTLSLWRLLCLCYYANVRLEVLKLTKHMEDGTIKARWRIRGLPFFSLLLRFYRKDKSHLYRSYDAFSTFYIGPDGLIHCHKVEKMMPAQPPVLPRVTSLLAGALVALGVQEHRPTLNLLPLLLSSLRQSRN